MTAHVGIVVPSPRLLSTPAPHRPPLHSIVDGWEESWGRAALPGVRAFGWRPWSVVHYHGVGPFFGLQPLPPTIADGEHGAVQWTRARSLRASMTGCGPAEGGDEKEAKDRRGSAVVQRATGQPAKGTFRRVHRRAHTYLQRSTVRTVQCSVRSNTGAENPTTRELSLTVASRAAYQRVCSTYFARPLCGRRTEEWISANAVHCAQDDAYLYYSALRAFVERDRTLGQFGEPVGYVVRNIVCGRPTSAEQEAELGSVRQKYGSKVEHLMRQLNKKQGSGRSTVDQSTAKATCSDRMDDAVG
ncbi:hypothetical protein RJ55_02885 [Drechmeria coniospora]|nr:hypothetical protein RJ55_02885 [Drechmeria coniospora]